MREGPVETPIPWITSSEMREVDRVAVEEYGIDLTRMMENAGAALARTARRLHLGGDAGGRRVVVLAGPGGNGGGAIVCARRLAGWGARVDVVLATPSERLGAVPGEQLAIFRRSGGSVLSAVPSAGEGEVDLVVDGVIGYSLKGAPRGGAARLVEWTDGAGAPVLSLDLPSGIDASTGQLPGVAVRASTTLTLALPKVGLRREPAVGYVGDLWLADIGIPPAVYAEALGIHLDTPFSTSDLVRLGPPPTDE